MKKEKLFVHIACNIVIVGILAVVVFFGLSGGAVTVFSAGNSAIYRGNVNEPRVSLMFNVYMGEENIDGIIASLAKCNAKATFFVGGSFCARHPEVIRKIAESGNELANHGYLHKNASGLSIKQNMDEISLCESQLKAIGVPYVRLFAPPSGDIGSNMFKAADTLGYKVIMWSKDTIDWRDKSADIVYSRATSDTKNGYLILMHPTAHTLQALPRVLKTLTQGGFRVTTVSENIAESGS